MQTNTFQCVLATNYLHSYVFFLYADGLMRWPGEPYALVGFNAGDGIHKLSLPTSQSEGVLHLTQTSNSASDIWIFRTDTDNIIQPGVCVPHNGACACMCVSYYVNLAVACMCVPELVCKAQKEGIESAIPNTCPVLHCIFFFVCIFQVLISKRC